MLDLLQPPRVVEANSHITFHELEAAIVLQVGYILWASGKHVVYTDDLIALREEPLAQQVTPYEPRPARDQRP